MPDSPPKPPRIDLLDIARGLALVAMASYHLTWDLEFFGYVEPGTTAHGVWKLYARAIASSFLMMAGVSLVLAHGGGIRWRPFWTRFLMVAGAAAAISAATWAATPDAFIFFGILHEIALGSLFGLAFLRLPALLNLALAAALIAGPHFLRAEIFDHPLLWWLGLAPVNPRSNDYVPVFPWFGAILTGMALARIAVATRLTERLARIRAGAWAHPLRLAGRHSLAVYLVHQPVLIAAIWLFSQVWPAPALTPQEHFHLACQANCVEKRDAAFCAAYCACMLGRIEGESLLDAMVSGAGGAELDSRVRDFALLCTGEAEGMEAP